MDGENRGEYDRSVVRALRSLEPLTGPTPAERQRIRDRILLSLEGEADDTDLPARPQHTDAPPSAVPAQRSRTPDQRNPTPDRRNPTPDQRNPTPDRRNPTPDQRSPTPDRRNPTPDQRSPTPDRRNRTRVGSRPASAPAGKTGPHRQERERGVMAGARGRLAVAALALLTLAGSLVGMSVLLARDALPGDALYGVKRTAEAASLGLTFGDEPRALKHLEFAAARISEIETLARRYPDPEDAPVGGYLTALTDFDNDATAGSRQLINLATRTDGRLLESLRDWSTQQASRLAWVAPQLPESARSRQSATRALLDAITTRADALLARMDCYQITSGSSDDIGALPATGQCEEPTPAPTTSTPQPSVPGTPDSSGTPPTGPEVPSTPLPPVPETPNVPPVPVPGATVPVPAPTAPPTTPTTPPTGTPPLIELPPLLPGLPPIGIG